MKILSLLLIVAIPLFAEKFESLKVQSEETPKEESKIPDEHGILNFVPEWPDSLKEKNGRLLFYWEQDREFQYQNGIVLFHNIEEIELNQGGIVKVDPSVDLGMIIPRENRMKMQYEKYKYAQPPLYRFELPNVPESDESDNKDESVTPDEK